MDPQKPPKEAPYDGNMGVPVAAPAPGYPPHAPQHPYYPPGAPAYGQPAPVDAYGRPIVNAVPLQTQTTVVANNANIRRDAAGNALCNKCSTPYPLPAGATSWRCRNCHELNNASIYGDECCIIL
ncbi:hypothetical protein Poli38472_013172 [Pythium oligandrum]|uniref:Uncharacterized protein n=1 Tax=Pythium oligandrum TaxID=41045 RepID=A0A8K1C2J2_PYTOL|nr:hypothetical protein Poli38472_013172 [Pythium oligandrum]|eukprot:TMW55281.1 hypothetical protein Poli38472_013172 [Pythium oligandrum]